jgi:hypothetical protein
MQKLIAKIKCNCRKWRKNSFSYRHSFFCTITKKAIEKFVAKYPTTTVVSYDAVSAYATRKANQISLGAAILPVIHYDKADVIVGFNADFLGTGIAVLENTKSILQ